jgi:nitrate reductase delta subunit
MSASMPTTLTLRALARLLGYPGAPLRAALGELRAALHADSALGAQALSALDALLDWIGHEPPLQVEAAYVETFDRGRATSLHLFEHVHGDSRDRGPAMIDLMQTYEAAGLFLADGELPDYLPALLEFASTQPPQQAREFIGETVHILQSIHAALHTRGSPYAAVLAAAIELAGETVRAPDAAQSSLAPETPLDQSWQEPAAFDGCTSAPPSAAQRPSSPQPIQIVRRPAAAGSAPHVEGVNP